MTTPIPPANQPTPPAGGEGGTAARYTDADLNTRLAQERRHAEQRAQDALLQRLGFASADEAEQQVTAQRAAQQAQMTEVERREQAAQAELARANQLAADAAARSRAADIRTALVTAGCRLDALDDAARLVDLPAGDVDQAALTAAVGAVQQRRAEMFGTVAAPHTDPGRGPAQGQQSATAGSGLGQRFADRYGYTKSA